MPLRSSSQSHPIHTFPKKKHLGTVCVRTFLQTCRRCRSSSCDTRSSLRHFNPFFSLSLFLFFKDPLKQHWLFPRMTFCRSGNDYADVAQPFPLTGGSHGGGGDTVDVASETSDRHVPLPPPCSTRPLVLSLAFSWMMEEPLSSTPFKTTKSSGWSNQIHEYFHRQNDELLWQFCSWISPLESGNNLGLSDPPPPWPLLSFLLFD